MRLFILFVVGILFISCGSDRSFIVSKVIDGNSIELTNGLSVDLVDVSDDPKNLEILSNLINKRVLLLDKDDEPIKKFATDRVDAYVYTEEGEYINFLIKTAISKDSNILSSSERTISSDVKPEVSPINSPQESLTTLYKRLRSSVFLIYTSDELTIHQGSGFFIESSGIAVSNYHVFKGTIRGKEEIVTHDGKRFKIKEILKKSAQFDYIVFSIENEFNEFFQPVVIASEDPEIGEDCFAIGNPRGLDHSLSKGLISQLRDDGDIIQTTADITHGSSGGPLFNMKGEVIGITFAGMGEASLNFAINIKMINK